MAEPRLIAGEDRPISPTSEITIINAIRDFRREAKEARKNRMFLSKQNRDAYLGKQDWSHKRRGQSREFLPKTHVAVEQLVGFIKRGLTQFGAWYDVSLAPDSQSPLAGHEIRSLMECFLDRCYTSDHKIEKFSTILTDAIKVGSLESLIIFKIHGFRKPDRRFVAVEGPVGEDLLPGTPVLQTRTRMAWNLRVDLIRGEDYYPDPTGRNLYEIHESEQDLFSIKRLADQGVYSKAAVASIEEDYAKEDEDKRRAIGVNQTETKQPRVRRRVKITEFWGTLLNEKGDIIHENIFCAIANDRYVIRKPTANPFWHQKSPFVSFPLVRVPFSTWHKALFDPATQLNMAMNELFNLMLDGGISSVWGVKQLRVDDLEDPRQVSDGVAQGDTLSVKSTLPHGAKVLETVSEGNVPTDAMAIFESLNREFLSAALTSELKVGSLPAKQVRATEVVELSQSQALTIDAMISDVESNLTLVLERVFLTIMQNLEVVPSEYVMNSIGLDGSFRLAQLRPAERYTIFSSFCSFKVHGLSAILARVRDFQKMSALLQMVTANPILMQAFFKKYSGDRILAHMMKTLNINPEQIERDHEEMARIDQDIAELPAFQQLTGQQGGEGGNIGGLGGAGTGGSSEAAGVAAQANPSAGLAGIGGS